MSKEEELPVIVPVTLNIADEKGHLCVVLSQQLRRKEPPFADPRAVENRKPLV